MTFLQIGARFIRTAAVTFVSCGALFFILAGMGVTAQHETTGRLSQATNALPQKLDKGVFQNEPTAYAPPPALYIFPSDLTLCGEKVPLHVPQVWESMDREFTIAVYNRAQAILWLKRSSRYFPYIEQRLRYRGLPDDIKYLIVAESDFLTYAYSSKNAAGSWQFIPATASRYGLRQEGLFDDRLSFERSTEAALSYLLNLHDKFGSWTLAMAAYNCGEERIEKEISEQGEIDYYRLNLPLETERYIFRILACKVVMSDPKRYGFLLREDQFYQPQKVDVLEVDFPEPMHMRVAAQACGSYFKEIKELNPEIQGNYFPRGKYTIRLPRDSKALFLKSYADWAKQASSIRHRVYVVKEGDTLQEIARVHGVEISLLKKWNSLCSNLIKPGQKLVIH
jgi:hypothetical protein